MISVVTVTYNNFSELKETISSIEGVQSIESVVINGGNCAKTLEFLSNYSGTVVNEKDHGISDAFSKGVRYSKGQAVAFLNSGDVLLDKEYYLWSDRVLREDPTCGFTYSDIIFMDPMAGPLAMKPRGRNRVNMGEGMPFPHPSMVVRREIFDQIGAFSSDYKIAMDFDFVVRLLAAGHKGVYYSHATVRMDGDGVSTSRELQGILECKKSLVSHGLFYGKCRLGFERRMFNFRLRSGIKSIFGEGILRNLKILKTKFK